MSVRMPAVLTLMSLTLGFCGQAQAQPRNRPGVFDYYLLSLSWSPQFCSAQQNAAKNPEQCGVGRRFAFVMHGLWPNNNRAPHPRNCAPRSTVPPALVKQMLGMMPSASLIQHEWDAHGTCDGGSQEDYFSMARTAFRLVTIPEPYREPARDLRVRATEIRRNFQMANASFPSNGIKFVCAGQFLREARLCFDKNLIPRSCSTAVQDTCGSRAVTLRRVR